MPSSRVSQTLASAAFGDEPGQWPLPAASTPYEHWLRAVAAGGQGHYAVAHSELADVCRADAGPLASLAHSTRGSLLRQLGWHDVARGWDGRALLLAGDDVEARVDALVGLAADALGTGRFAASAALLDTARGALTAACDPPPRLAIRLQWVAAELAMATGYGAVALRHAEQGVAVAAAPAIPERHRVKSEVVLAAAHCCAGQLDTARVRAESALDRTGTHGLIPLRWALASLLASIGSTAFSGEQILAIRDESADLVRRRGGRWCAR